MVGSSFRGIKSEHEIILPRSGDYDLLSQSATAYMLHDHRPDAVIHLAARVGGVKGNTDYVADFFSDNILINTNVLKVSRQWGVKKIVSLLSTCVYPDKATYPLTEDQLHNGAPHHSNFGYAYAKRMVDVMSRAYRQQYNSNFITAVPNNLYGENDNFDLENGHVMPALMRKIWEATINDSPTVECWGDGSPLREFTYSKDLAAILLFLLENYEGEHPVNIGNTEEHSIKNVAEMLCNHLGYGGELIWNTDKPSGQFRKPSSNKKFLDLGWEEKDYTSLEEGLKKTCEWFKMNYPRVRGVK